MDGATSRRQSGFTLIEILVTIVILSIGLLGIAGMQATSLRNNHAAYSKTQAANLAMDMADRIRANPNGRDQYGGFDSRDDAPANPGCIAAGCSAAQLAQHDLFEWSQPLKSADHPLLPQGRGLIARNGDQFTVTLAWYEPQIEDIDLDDCGIGDLGEDMACFQMSFVP